ncbi:hypothetical protein IP69_16325 [Bosea sp. AAP35]|nr:hypothetical protein IP69_16325 [Bosea sp. AAP35]
MVADSSAIIAIAFGEPEATLFQRVLSDTSDCVCSAVTFTECVMVLIGKRAATPLREVEALFDDLKIRPAALDIEQGRLASEAFLRFGKSRHPARLNLGDCFSYALAKSLNAPLLYKGEDFARTDIVPAAATGAKP